MSNDGLAEFLLARIAEDEAAARSRHVYRASDGPAPFGELIFEGARVFQEFAGQRRDVTDEYRAWWDSLPLSDESERVLAECEAKRRIIAASDTFQGRYVGCNAAFSEGQGCDVWDAFLREMAAVYAAHPDYPLRV